MRWSPKTVEPNLLLARPPGRFHKLQNTTRYRKLLGRSPREDDYDGVHTTSSELIAAAYAMSAWRQSDDGAYPILITLDVASLTPLPDVDAELRGAEAADDLLSHYRQLVRDGSTFDDLAEDDSYRELDAQVGDDPAAFVFEDTGHHVIQSIRDYAEAEGVDEDEIFDDFLKTGKLPSGVLTRMVQQQRYMADFDLDRVVRIEAIKPWWEAVLLSYDDEEDEEKIQEIGQQGYYVFTMDDWPFSDPGDRKTLYEAPDAADREKVEYHGTTSAVVERAFPELIPEETPFPVRDADE